MGLLTDRLSLLHLYFAAASHLRFFEHIVVALNKMIDDTRGEACTLSASQVVPLIDEIAKHRISRFQIRGWARRLKFLTFDENNDCEVSERSATEKTTDENSREQCAKCEFRVPLPNDHHKCSEHRLHRQSRSPYNPVTTKSNLCEHVREVTCWHCETVPLFPNDRKATRFKIRRVTSNDFPYDFTFPGPEKKLGDHNEWPCGHFVAVSYCWAAFPTQSADRDDHPYKVIEEDGSERKARASKEALDRAVAFAAQNGYRMIWIDQECIDQDNEEEKKIAVQAMDAVYLYAHVTIGLFTSQLRRRHWEQLMVSPVWLGKDARELPKLPHEEIRYRDLDKKTLCEALTKVTEDPWCKRAWILQEAFASAGKIVVLFPCSRKVVRDRLYLVCHEQSFTELCIDLRVLHSRLRQAAQHLSGNPSANFPINQFLDRLTWFQPAVPLTSRYDITMGGNRRKDPCNAAVAVSFLRHRDNGIVSDRLAIVANLCEYELRLDGSALEAPQPSLALCMVALAVMNGDLSLLTPDVHSPVTLPRASPMSFSSLLLEAVRELPTVRWTKCTAEQLTMGRSAPESYALSGQSLRLPGFLWQLDRFVVLADLQIRYSQRWASLGRKRTALLARKKHIPMDPGAWQKTYNPVAEHASRRERAITQILFDTLQYLRKSDEAVLADAIWHCVYNPQWRSSRFAGAKAIFELIDSVEKIPASVQVENRGGMFNLERIDELTYHSEWLIDRIMEEGGVWSASLIRGTEDHSFGAQPEITSKIAHHLRNLIDETHIPPVIEEFNKTSTSEDWYFSAFFGRVRRPLGTTLSPEAEINLLPTLTRFGHAAFGMEVDQRVFSQHELSDQEIEQAIPMLAGILGPTAFHDFFKVNGKNIESEIRKAVSPTEMPNTKENLRTRIGISTGGFMWRQMLAFMFTFLETYPNSTTSKQYVRSRSYFEQKTYFHMLFAKDDVFGLEHFLAFSKQRAIFDVPKATHEGELILTPFQLSMEELSAPALRNTSLSHVVERVDVDRSKEQYESFRSKQMVKGMWQLMPHPAGRYTLV